MTRRILPALAIIAAFTALTFALFGNILTGSETAQAGWWNLSLFPYSVPVGILLIWLAVRRHQIGWAIAAGVCLSPYVNQFTWAFVWIGIAKVLDNH